MSIKSFLVPESESKQIGLKSINMQRLSRTVALAGKNGSGKSRILQILQACIHQRTEAITNLPQRIINLNNLEARLLADTEGHFSHEVESSIAEHKRLISNATDRVITENLTPLKPVRFVPQGLNLADPSTQPPTTTIQLYNIAKNLGVDGYDGICLSYISHLQTKWWNAKHPDQGGDEIEKKIAIEDYEKFENLIFSILNTKLGRNLDGYPTLYNSAIPNSGLSNGQKVLLQICVAMHAQNSEISNAIFILDEPENHLHPSAVIDIFQSLQTAAPESQIWVATHSVPLLAYIADLDPMSIWYVDDGGVSNAGRYPERVLQTLLGDQDRLEQLCRFTGLPSQLAIMKYAAESLLPPLTLNYGKNDPQVSQIMAILANYAAEGAISVLDFGAGKGRLLSGLAAELVSLESNISERIDYYAYDLFSDDKTVCNEIIESLYSDKKPRYFNSRDELFSCKEDNSISIAIMCNVLHEIPPSEWPSLFSEHSLINRAISSDRYLMIVEDQRIPVGEMAHPLGFLVLDTAHLRTLFAVTEQDTVKNWFLEHDARNDGRLKAHFISRHLFERVTASTTKTAIQQLRETAKDQIKKLRSETPTYSNGQLHGFWTQQFANASLYIDDNQ